MMIDDIESESKNVYTCCLYITIPKINFLSLLSIFQLIGVISVLAVRKVGSIGSTNNCFSLNVVTSLVMTLGEWWMPYLK